LRYVGGTRREIAIGLIKDLLDLGSQALAGFKDNIQTLLAVIAVTCCSEAFPISAHQ
jgi:hypothetical protein